MTDFYKAKKVLMQELENVINKNKGSIGKISAIKFSCLRNYGFGETTIMNMLKIYEEMGLIKLDKENDEIHFLKDKKELSKKKKR